MRVWAQMEVTLPSIAVALGKAVAPGAVRVARSLGRQKYDDFVATYTNAFDEFLQLSQDKCAHVKTLLNQQAAVDLQDIYVNVDLTYQGGERFEDVSILENIKSGCQNFAVIGLAGCGKSMLMRWLALSLIDSLPQHQKIPLFVEIRDLDLSSSDQISLDEVIFEYCTSPISKRNIEQFRVGLKEGLFVVLLDGIDELPPDKIDEFLRSLGKFAETYRNSAMVASARPGTRLTNLTRFYVYAVQELSLSKVVSVLEKAPFDRKRKSILIKALEEGLYESHKSFLSNPLLVTITLITFDDASRIPDNVTGFYAAAFDALFAKHDWAKGVFTRKRYSGLEKSEFEKIFQYFCYQSYFQSSYVFSHDEVVDLLAKSIALAQIQVDPEAYLKDCVVSVSLLLVDEPKITFVHRSFQEYFTARFIAGYLGSKVAVLLEWLANRISTDNTFVMAAQLNRELLVRHWGLPRARDLRNQFAQWIQRGQAEKLIEYAGLRNVGCDLRTGEVTSFGGVESSGACILRAIFTLADVQAANVPVLMFSANAYGHRQFGELGSKTQSLIRNATDSHQIVRINFDQMAHEEGISEILESLAAGQAATLDGAIQRLEEYIANRDHIADLVGLARPWESILN